MKVAIAGMRAYSCLVLRCCYGEFAAAPEIKEKTVAALAAAQRDGAMTSFSREAFEAISKAPLDILVMEATRYGAVAPCDIGWADIGSWDEVHRLSPHDEAGNARHGGMIRM